MSFPVWDLMPGKVIYELFENDPDIELEFHLTERLGLGTVANLRRTMGQDEFRAWKVYLGRERQRDELANPQR